MSYRGCIPSPGTSLLLLLFLAAVGCGSGTGGGTPIPGADDASLAMLEASAGALSPAFAEGTSTYTVVVGNGTAATTVTPILGDAAASVTVNGMPVASGTPSPLIAVAVGLTTITVAVTAEDGATTRNYLVRVVRYATRDLIDPTPGAGDQFGARVRVLDNGNVVVTDPFDSSVVPNGGAVHVYGPASDMPFASLYGDAADDNLGSGGVTALVNGNFVIRSPEDDEGGVVNAGSVRLVDGTTGAPIGAPLTGDVQEDKLGSGGVTVLPNGRFVIRSPEDDAGGVQNAGSVRLVDGTTGAPVGAPLTGDVQGDRLGSGGVTALASGNFVVVSPDDDEGGVVNAGSVRLVDGTTGAPIGAPLTGDVQGDRLGSGGVRQLSGGHFVVVSPEDDEGGVVDAGSVHLVHGATGAPIGAPLTGDVQGDRLGSGGVRQLSGGHFVVVSPEDDEGGVVNAGSVRLVDGTTGAPIGTPLTGDVQDDLLGFGGVTALANGHVVVLSPADDEGGIVDAGSARLLDGTTGVPIGTPLTGDVPGDMATGQATPLPNGNYVVHLINDDEAGLENAGSVRLVDGTTGVPIGAALVGDVASDRMGTSVTALPGGNYVVASPEDDEGGIAHAGSVRLFDGTTGAPIGAPLTGDDTFDVLGNFGVTALAEGDVAFLSAADDVGGVSNAGSMRLLDGTTGATVTTLRGASPGDFLDVRLGLAPHGAFFLVALPRWDDGGVDAGRVRLIAE